MYTKNLAIALSTLTLFASVTLYAETPKQAEVPPCSTSVECDVMEHAVQIKLNALKTKGVGNLSGEEFEQYAKLLDERLAIAKAKNAAMLKAQNKELAEMKKIFKEKTK